MESLYFSLVNALSLSLLLQAISPAITSVVHFHLIPYHFFVSHVAYFSHFCPAAVMKTFFACSQLVLPRSQAYLHQVFSLLFFQQNKIQWSLSDPFQCVSTSPHYMVHTFVHSRSLFLVLSLSVSLAPWAVFCLLSVLLCVYVDPYFFLRFWWAKLQSAVYTIFVLRSFCISRLIKHTSY